MILRDAAGADAANDAAGVGNDAAGVGAAPVSGRRIARRWLPLVLLALAPTALAYETDQLTDRAVPLRDAEVEADARAEELLRAAVARTNEETRCQASPERTHRALAARIYEATSFPTFVKDRGELAGLGYGAYAAWLETDPRVDRRFVERTGDIYDRLKPLDSLVLGTVGVCSTIRLAGILMGTDKPDHFWAQGYEYYLASGFGRRDDRAIAWGTLSERGQYGLATSGVFSYADLAADWEGYQFYTALLSVASPIQRGPDGCVALSADFHWRDWITDAVDEVLNPPNYVERVGTAVREELSAERARVCAGWADWGPEVIKRRGEVAALSTEYLSPKAPPRVDEWGLEALCGG